MKRLLMIAFCFTVAWMGLASAQSSNRDGVVIRLDPRLDEIVSVDARLEVLAADYFGFTEGTVWIQEGQSGYALFSDMGANRIYKWTPDGTFSVFLERSGFSGSDFSDVRVINNGRLNVAIGGTNGLAVDREGRLIMCTHGDRSIVRLEEDGTRTVLADRYKGKRLNGPNDLAVKSDGAIYFTDRGSGLPGGGLRSPLRELPTLGVFRLKDGNLQLLETPGMNGANGIAFSPDESVLYFTHQGKIWRYDVQGDGTITNGRVLIDTTNDTENLRGGTDGMTVDRKGNIFTTGPGGVWIASPDGTVLGKIRLPGLLPGAETEEGGVTNVAFGDPDGKGLFINGSRGFYRIRLSAPAK